jgi:hypothetical protein
MSDLVASLERSLWERNRAHLPECHLCWAWLPFPADELREVRCTGCGATYINLGAWRRALSSEDAANPYHSALHMRRYGISAEYVQALGWVVPPPWMTVRFPGEPVAP